MIVPTLRRSTRAWWKRTTSLMDISKTFKPSARLIEDHRSFFDQLVDVEEICILGHSLAEVDKSYFDRLLAIPAIASAPWRLAARPKGRQA
jgi:hypothetical protein